LERVLIPVEPDEELKDAYNKWTKPLRLR